MFDKVRLQLTILYLLISLVIVVAIGGVAYGLLAYYFAASTDLALRHKMAHEFEVQQWPMPTELALTDIYWEQIRNSILALPFNRPKVLSAQEQQEAIKAYEAWRLTHPHDYNLEEANEPELGSVFRLPLSAQGQLLPSATAALVITPNLPNQQAVQTAQQNGFDLRTVRLDNGNRVRLLTYRVPIEPGGNNSIAYMQLGYMLNEQAYILRQLLIALMLIGGIVAVIVSAGSWWAAGRSLSTSRALFRQQRHFVANASHELRTPLTLIRASAEVAASHPGLSSEDKGLLHDIIGEVDHMTKLVDDLLLLSRLDVRQLKLESQPVVVTDLLADVQRATLRLANERNKTLRVFHTNGIIQGDRSRLRQVLLILVDNALRHTPAGGFITLEAEQQGWMVTVRVKDTGMGIAAEHLPHLFERFYQVDNTRTAGGTGLGLSIAKALVEAHKGEIRLESELGRGTTVTITLPSY